MKEETKQTIWEAWLILSLVSLIVLFITGVMESSKIDYPNWPYFAGIVIINLVFCLKIGTHVPKDDGHCMPLKEKTLNK